MRTIERTTEEPPRLATNREVYALLAREHAAARAEKDQAAQQLAALKREWADETPADIAGQQLLIRVAETRVARASVALTAARHAIHGWLARTGVTIAEMTADEPNTEPMPSMSQERYEANVAHADDDEPACMDAYDAGDDDPSDQDGADKGAGVYSLGARGLAQLADDIARTYRRHIVPQRRTA